MRQLKDLNPNPRNPRKITDEKAAMLEKSMERFGDLSGIIFNRRTEQLIGGHQRMKRLPGGCELHIETEYETPTEAGTIAEGHIEFRGEKFKYREVDVDEDTEKAMNIAANKHGGEFDIVKLNEFLLELDAANFDMELTGFSYKELEDLLAPIQKHEAQEDEDAEYVPPKDPIPKRGDLYSLGSHRLLCGDSTVSTDLDRLMHGDLADLVFTDPPYGVAYEGGHNKKKRSQIKNDSLAGDDLTDLFHDALSMACAFSKDHSAFYIWYANGKAVETFKSFALLPLKVRAVICWYKVNSGLGAFMSQYIPNYEPCIYAFKEGCTPQWFGPTDEKTVWELKKERVNEYHPTQKPVELAARAIANSSKEKQIVLDLFGGSGSTLIAAEKTGRFARLVEIDPAFVQTIIERWCGFTGQEAYLLNADGSDTSWTDLKNQKAQ